MMTFETHSPQETFDIAKKMGEEAKVGTVITLDGDLGAGKTLFTKGFAAGLGITEPVSSPTFTILQEYSGGRFPLYHFDVYRIGDPMEMEEIGFDDFIYGDGVCLIEWSELIAELIPDDAVKIRIERSPQMGDDYRRINIWEKSEKS